MIEPDELNELLSSVDELLAPIPGEDPAGDAYLGENKSKLENYRKEVEADEFDPESQARGPEWGKLISLAREVLTTQSKHLLVAAQLTEAYTKSYGWGGFLVGLKLLRGLVEQCWDRLHPKLTPEDNDPELLATPFEWLGMDKRGAWFPQTIRNLSLFAGNRADEGGVTTQDFKNLSVRKANKEDLDRIIATIPVETSQKRLAILEQCWTELQGLNAALNDKMGSNSPSTSDLKDALQECISCLKSQLPKAAAADSGKSSESVSGSGSAGESTSGGGESAKGSLEAAMTNRSDAYARLEEAARLLERLEPHSPIPYLIRRAVLLGALPFPLLMRELIRDPNILNEMNRELGIKDEASPHQGEAPHDGYS